jgi:hypothetical protein
MAKLQLQSKLSSPYIYPLYSLGHWCEVNEELMSALSKYEPPMDVEEKDLTFLKLDRNPNHIVICS